MILLDEDLSETMEKHQQLRITCLPGGQIWWLEISRLLQAVIIYILHAAHNVQNLFCVGGVKSLILLDPPGRARTTVTWPLAGAAGTDNSLSGNKKLVSGSLWGPAESHNPSMRLDHFNGTEAQTEKPQVLTFSHISDINDLLWKSAAPDCGVKSASQLGFMRGPVPEKFQTFANGPLNYFEDEIDSKRPRTDIEEALLQLPNPRRARKSGTILELTQWKIKIPA